MKVLLNKIFLPLLLFGISYSSENTDSLFPREQYSVPLAKLSVTIDQETGKCDHVRISFDGSKDHSQLGIYDDLYIKDSRNSTEKTTYRELPERAYLVTDFEAEQILKVSKSLLSTLEIFEKDLQNVKRGKWLYLDSYLPRFLNGFYSLIEVATNSTDILPESTFIPDSLYDVSISSPKSDARIKRWYSTPEHIVKLRIATKELIFQLKVWQQQNLGNKRNPEKLLNNDINNSLSLFIKFYFNQITAVQQNQKKK